MSTINSPWIKLTETIHNDDFPLIQALQEKCISEDHTALKLELDYKLGCADTEVNCSHPKNINEFMYFDGEELIGYIGICPGRSGIIEVNGMVHPDYRRRGVFTQLYNLVESQWTRRNSGTMLLLCDRDSASGQAFIQRTGTRYLNSEYEMYLDAADFNKATYLSQGIILRKATNHDAREIAHQNSIYFDELHDDDGDTELILPEAEEQKGLIIFIAEKEQEIIGKVHLQLTAAYGGIFGLGVLPEHRRRGYGREILLGAAEKLTEMGAQKIMLQVAAENANALKLYQSCGFVYTSIMDYYERRLPQQI